MDQFKTARSPAVVAHRGLHRFYPENSLAAFTAAWSLPVQWCECDVHILSGGVVVLHDEALDRMTEMSGSIYDKTADQLQNCRLRDGQGHMTAHALPRLKQLTAAMPRQGKLMVEVKGSTAADFMPDLMRELQSDAVLIQSFDPGHLKLASRYDCALSIAYLVENELALADALASPYPAIHLQHKMLDEKLIRTLRQKGKCIGAWTVNEAVDIQRMVDLGVDRLITDEPELALKMIATQSPATSAAVGRAAAGAPPSDQTP